MCGYRPLFRGAQGAHAELTTVPLSHVRLIPEDLDFVTAAAMPVAGLTALRGLDQCHHLAGAEVIVNGATGGVEHFALQMAAARGADDGSLQRHERPARVGHGHHSRHRLC